MPNSRNCAGGVHPSNGPCASLPIMGSEGNLASLSSPPDPLIGRTLAVVRQRPRPQLRLFFVIAAACLAVSMLLTVGAWAWTSRFPTPALVVTPALILVSLFASANGVWNRPPLVVGEGGFEARWTLKRLQVVTWDEVVALVRDGNTLRVDLRDRKRFLQRRAGRTAFLRMPFRYPSLPLTMFDLPPTDVADLMLSSFDVWKARER